MKSEKSPTPIWVYAVLALAMIAVYVAVSIEWPGEDPRPVGSPADIETLGADRDDLNVLFILVDTLRASRLSTYGYDRETSPRLTELAASGIRFDGHLSQSSWTKTSMASLWTSLYPTRNQVLRFSDAIAPEATLPAEVLSDAGYHTAAIWRNGWVAPNFGFSQGFASYHNPAPSPIPASVRRENPTMRLDASDDDVINSAKQFLRSYSDERWMLYLHMMDVHQYLYDEESALFGTTYSDVYDNSVRRTDRLIGSLIDELERLGLRDRTLVVIAADHGEAFGEHGFEGHARDLYSPVTHTPWLISLPFRLEEGIVVEAPTANVDVWPTIFDLIDVPQIPNIDGRSRLPEVMASLSSSVREDTPTPEPRFAQLDRHWGFATKKPRPIVAVTDGRYRLVHHVNEPEALELYDLSTDPGELKNLVKSQPETAARLNRVTVDYLKQMPPWEGGAPQVEIDEMHLNQLRALGYVLEK